MSSFTFSALQSVVAQMDWALRQHPHLKKSPGLAVVILDGWGEQIDDQYNAIHVASTPTMDALKEVQHRLR